MRHRLVLLLSIGVVTGCGDDDDGGAVVDGGGIDAPESALGRTCTAPDGPVAQGDCPDGYYCIGFPGGNHTFCSQPCTGIGDPTCDTDYAGPGYGGCFGTATIGGADTPICGVLCTDPAGTPDVCPSGRCTGACPTELGCELALPMGLVACR